MNSLLLSPNFLQATEITNPYIVAAKNQRLVLSEKIGREFTSSVSPISELKPVFFAAVCGAVAMDKISKMAKSGQLPWHPGGIGNGAYNTLIKNMRKFGRIFREKQSQTYRLAAS